MMSSKNSKEIITQIVVAIKSAHKLYPDLFCDANSVNALFCDILIDYEEYIAILGYPLFDGANPFGEFYYLKVLRRIDELMNNTYFNNEDIGNTIYKEISQGKTLEARKFFAKLLESALTLKKCKSTIFPWTKCPVCGAPILPYEGQCSKCKTSFEQYDVIEKTLVKAKNDIQALTIDERSRLNKILSGLNFPIPITVDGSFYSMKQEIENIAASKVKSWDEEDKKNQDQKIKKAKEIIKEYIAKLDVECGKENPDFNRILNELLSEAIIKETLKYESISKEIKQFREKIAKCESDYLERKKIAEEQAKLVKSINKLLDIVNILSAEMECRARNIDEIRALLKQADVEYSIIVNCIRNGANYNNKNSKSAVEDYANNLRVAVLKFLEIDERESLLDKQENELMSRVNALLAKLSNITAKDNKAQEYEEMFVSEIEGNEQFSLLREECSQRYDEIVFALRKRIKQLRQEENSLKLVAFKKESAALITQIESTIPKKLYSSIFEAQIKEMDRTYSSISTNLEYQQLRNKLLDALRQLKKAEAEYNRKKKKRNFRVRLASILTTVIIVLFGLSWFLCELSGVAPSLILSSVPDDFIGKENDSYITVSGATDNVKNVTIEEKARLPWTLSAKKVTTIGDSAFKENSNLESILLPKTITTIGDEAFESCVNLKMIVLQSTAPPQIQDNTFNNYSGVFYVPVDNYLSYLSDDKWGKYSENIFPNYSSGIDSGCILFDVNGGSYVENMPNVALNTTVELPIPHKTGYHFMGWYFGQEEFVSNITIFNRSVKLVALWSEISELRLNSNCGVEAEEREIEIAIGERMDLPFNDFINPGYHFVGWSTTIDGKIAYLNGDSFTMGEDIVTLYAQWEANENILRFNCGSGEGEMTSLKIKTGDKINLPLNTFTKMGCDFCGWSVSLENPEIKFMDGDEYIMGTESEYTLYALWQIHTFTIIYNLNGGTNSENNPADFNISSESIELSPATREGYSFEGWYTEEEFQNKVQIIEKGTVQNYELYARWIANTNVLFFDGNGGIGDMEKIEVLSDESIALPSCTFTKLGYEFIGWSLDRDGTFAYHNTDTYLMGVQPEYTLYAMWLRLDYAIIYNLNGGINSQNNPTSYHIESADIVLSNPTRDGFLFDGWYTDSSLTTTKISTIERGSSGELVLYAKWNEKTNILLFDANGGDGSMPSIELNTFASCTLPLCTYSMVGYRFAGWGLSASGMSVYSDGAFFEMGTTSSITLYAVWSQSAYTIMYNLDGGTNNSNNPAGYNVDSDTIILSNPSKRGYKFQGWYTNAAKTYSITKINSGSTGNIVLYADWTASQYTVTYDFNGGSGSPNNKSVIFDSAYGALPIPIRNGYSFGGWYYGNTRIYDTSNVSIANNHTLTAKWSAKIYTVYFDYGRGTQGTVSKNVTFGSSYGTLPSTSLTGHNFNGWYYQDTLITSSSQVNVADNHTLEARFTPINYTVSISASNVTVTVKRLDTNAFIGNGSKVPYGTRLSITYSANDGYQNAWCNPNGTITVTGNVSISAGAEKVPCIATGTLITLADGSQKPVEKLLGDEMLLVWNIYTGKFDVAPILFIDSDAETTYEIINLYFSDGTNVRIIYEHAFWDYNLNQWVFLREDAAQYIGHWFNKQNIDKDGKPFNLRVQLSNVIITEEISRAWSPVTYGHLCYYTNGMLSMPGATEGFINIFDVDPHTMKVDETKMTADIERYGLFTYEDFAEYIPEEVFHAFNGQYLKVAIGKGLLTWDDIFALINRYQEFWR